VYFYLNDAIRPVWALLLVVRSKDWQPEHPAYHKYHVARDIVRDVAPHARQGRTDAWDMVVGSAAGKYGPKLGDLLTEAGHFFEIAAQLTEGMASRDPDDAEREEAALDALFEMCDNLFRRVLELDYNADAEQRQAANA
jgi:hypothetical protein